MTTFSAGEGVRLLRAVVATLVVVGLGAVAHEMGGGAPLSVLPAVILTVLVGPLVWVTVRRRTSLARMLLATALGQVLVHVALVGMTPGAGGVAPRPHLHDAMPAMAQVPATSTGTTLTGSMLLAHAVATVVASLLLTRGADLVAAVVRLLVVPVAAHVSPVPGRAPVAHVLVRVPDGRSIGALGGRAPPLRPV
ncbi:hypothetical protein [Phycicoccus avicenniae]|uniref:hypothetical protein n=1 Tax=Phycicoccus avicenniae TaxID=2828860 RepID=UPI003D2D2F16